MITREFLKDFYRGSWMADCVDYLDDSFFNVKYEPTPRPLSLIEQIFKERDFRKSRNKMIPKNEIEQEYKKDTLEASEVKERMLINKMEYQEGGNDDKEKARRCPIDSLIQFKHDFAKCPWHKDTDPSLHLIRESNVAYCFSCNKSYDSIDACMLIHGCSFPEAIKRLINSF